MIGATQRFAKALQNTLRTMPSLRVIPVGNPMAFGKFLETKFPPSGEISFHLLDPVNFVQAAGALKTEKADIILFSLDGTGQNGFDLLQAFLHTSGEAVVIVVAKEYDASVASACIRAGAQEFVAVKGIAAPELARTMVHAWERHVVWRDSNEARKEMLSRVDQSDMTVNQLSARMKEAAAERIHAEKVLVETVARYRFLLDSLPQIVWTADASGALVYINAFWARYSGRSVQETLAEGWGDGIHPEDAAATEECWLAAIKNGESFDLQRRLIPMNCFRPRFLSGGAPKPKRRRRERWRKQPIAPKRNFSRISATRFARP